MGVGGSFALGGDAFCSSPLVAQQWGNGTAKGKGQIPRIVSGSLISRPNPPVLGGTGC